ncbi:long-chain fatty acid--CoA ligase [bacterium]|nr:long-chain fatty acid--CoA ligase [candidate division CSSED10-310 bacterium]
MSSPTTEQSIQTLVQAFLATCERQPAFPALKFKENNHWLTLNFSDFKDRAFNVAGTLMTWGIEKGDRIAILSNNRPEWVISDMGIMCAGGVTVPLYASLQQEQIRYILAESECKIIFLEDREQLDKIRAVRERLPALTRIVLMDPLSVEMDQTVCSFNELALKPGLPEGISYDAIMKRCGSVDGEDLASIVYTSGTTGKPKGVMLSHRNFTSNVQSILVVYDIFPEDIFLSFLPLAHVLERTGGFFLGNIFSGAQYAFVESVDKVAQNILEVSPTIFVAVPRLFEKMYTRILSTVESSGKLKKSLFNWALRTGEHYQRAVRTGKPGVLAEFKHRAAYNLVYKKLHGKLGGRLRLVVSGGAPLEPRIAEFFAAIDVIIMEGYGLTETSPVTNVNMPDRCRIGSVGPALPGVGVRVAEDGEIMIKGPNVMKGYYKDPEATEEVMTADGWFKTGDIGRIDPEGFLWITDRKKEIIVTSGGKNVAPQPIENLLKTSPFINQVMLIGDKRNFIAALIVPDFDALKTWGEDKGLANLDPRDLMNHPLVLEHYETEIADMTQDLPRFEKIKKLLLIEKDWLPETGELTPTQKLKRRVIMDKYRDRIESLYRNPSGNGNGFG